MEEKSNEPEIMNESNSTPDAKIKEVKTTKSGKPKKPYEWTEKRTEAFEKMRQGLQDKVEITKRLKEEKKHAERNAIKVRVKQIMESKKGPLKEYSESSSSESSEEEAPRAKKKSHVEKREAIAAPALPLKKRKEVIVEASSSDGESGSDSDTTFAAATPHYTPKQHKHYQHSKLDRGKALKVAQFVSPLDKYILL